MSQPRPWLAVLLSLFAPGLGQLYSGHVARSLTIAVLIEILSVLVTLYFVLAPLTPIVLFALPVLGMAVAIAIAVDAWRLATRGQVRFTRRATRIAAILLFLVGVVTAGELLSATRNRLIGEPFRMPSGAMFPTLLVGDHFFSNQLAFRSGEPKRGDVVVVVIGREGSAHFPADLRPELPREYFVKRIVGVPGDQVAFRGAHLLVNGIERTGSAEVGEFTDPDGHLLRELPESLDSREYRVLDSDETGTPDFGPMTVETGRYFIAGDNRDHSKDSRYIGTVSRDCVLAPTSRIYWSWDFNGSYLELINPLRLARLVRERTRWSRIGLPTN